MAPVSSLSAETAIVRRDAFLGAVTRAAALLSGADPWESMMNEVLKTLGEATGVDRTYVFQVESREGVDYASQRFEWCAAGVSPQIDNPDLQEIPLEAAGFGRWATLLRVGEPVFGDIESFPETERPLLEMQGIKSLLVQPILVGRLWWGFLGFDACSTAQSWERYEVNKLLIVSLLLGAAIHRRMHEQKLLQAQRAEALGTLAGGVAHDLNNLITVVSAAAGMIKNGIDPASARAAAQTKSCGMIEQAIERARNLTRRLLDFSRRRGVEPQVIVPLEFLKREEPLLRSSLGSGIALEILSRAPEHPLSPIMIDPAEFTQLLLNIAVNAKDAMPQGGHLTFEVCTLKATDIPAADDTIPEGRWTLIRAFDSGEGIQPEIIEHIFEPFFTTKPADKGTGLGLATIRNIVTNAGGHIRVSSTVGCGTEFRFYFPVSN